MLLNNIVRTFVVSFPRVVVVVREAVTCFFRFYIYKISSKKMLFVGRIVAFEKKKTFTTYLLPGVEILKEFVL